MQCLLYAVADIEKVTNKGATPLQIAVFQGHQAVVQCLLDVGADKEKVDSMGRSPLPIAAQQGHQAGVLHSMRFKLRSAHR